MLQLGVDGCLIVGSYYFSLCGSYFLLSLLFHHCCLLSLVCVCVHFDASSNNGLVHQDEGSMCQDSPVCSNNISTVVFRVSTCIKGLGDAEFCLATWLYRGLHYCNTVLYTVDMLKYVSTAQHRQRYHPTRLMAQRPPRHNFEFFVMTNALLLLCDGIIKKHQGNNEDCMV